MGKRILVCGGAGYIGSHVAKALVRKGHHVLNIDDLSTGFRHLLRYGAWKKVDLRNEKRISGVVREFRPQGVFHFANSSLVGESNLEPLKYYENNLLGTVQLLKALRALRKPVPLVFSSTCAVYGEPKGPLDESHPLDPVSPYGRSKLVVEMLLQDAGKAYGQPYIALRYFNAAGADLEGELGECHQPETHLIPRLLQVAAGQWQKNDRVQILGDDYPTPDGTCVRDYIHVQDLATAHVLAFDYLASGGESCALNLGTGQGHSVREVIQMVEQITGKRLSVPVGPRRLGDPASLVAVGSKAETILGWRPKLNLRTIVDSAWNWAQR